MRKTMNQQFIKAVDVIFEAEKKSGSLLYVKDVSISNLIYKNNRGLVSSVREGKKNIPHNALVTFSKHFGISMDYFYDPQATWQYKGMHTDVVDLRVKNKKVEKAPFPGSYRWNTANAHHKELEKEQQHYKKMMVQLTKSLTPEQQDTIVPNTYDILFHLISEREKVSDKLTEAMQSIAEKDTEIKTLQATITLLNTQLSTAEQHLIKAKDETIQAKERENKVLRKYLDIDL